MAKAAFLYTNLAAGLAAAAGSSAPVSGLGWDRLNESQPRHRARVDNTSATLIFDLGSAQAVDCAALISTSLLLASTVRARASAVDPSCVSSLLHDSGVQAAVTDAKYNGNVIQCLSAAVTTRYWRWDVTGAAPIDIGLAPLGLLFRPGRNFSFGVQEGMIDFGTRDTNPDTGASFGVAGPIVRCRLLNFAAMSKSEARAQIEDLDRVIGAARDCLFVEDPDAAWLVRAQASIWGSYRSPGQAELATRAAYNVFARPFRLVERI
ncbi:MAG TPA: hypothetical protein VGF92_03875 [Stellaceae bacterium]